MMPWTQKSALIEPQTSIGTEKLVDRVTVKRRIAKGLESAVQSSTRCRGSQRWTNTDLRRRDTYLKIKCKIKHLQKLKLNNFPVKIKHSLDKKFSNFDKN